MAEEFPVEIYNKLKGFFMQYIGSKGLYGVNYAIFFKEETSAIKACTELKEEIQSYGYSDNQIFRVCAVSNGFVFDLDTSLRQKILEDISKEVSKELGEDYNFSVTEQKNKNKDEEKTNLVKVCKDTLDRGINTVELVIYSLSQASQVILPCVTETGESVVMYYPAYTVSLWDLVDLQKTKFLEQDIQISKVEICEILPYKKGVRVILHLTEWKS